MTSRFLPEEVLRRAAALIVDGEGEDHAAARAVWSLLAEPGDGVAGALVAAIGPTAALALVAGEVSAPQSDVSGAVAEGLRRWRPRLVEGAAVTMLRDAARAGLRLVTPESRLWPSRLDDLGAHAPLCLWVRGDPGTLAGTAAYW